MLTIITGTPGAGKSLYTVWEICRHVPGSTVEQNGQPLARRLLANIKDLLVEHEHITGADLETWHQWARPGDVIVFDEVQEVWRPRGLGTKVPDCIAALETHRHKGVDILLVTQHPMLIDPNIRRLCNRHLHLRRITKTWAMVYEWDHCANPGQTKSAIESRMWHHPKAAYSLYKSAQVHTKPTARLPKVVWVGVLAVAAGVYMVPTAIGRVTDSLGGKHAATTKPATTPAGGPKAHDPLAIAPAPLGASSGPVPGPSLGHPVEAAKLDNRPVEFAGCIVTPTGCECTDTKGRAVDPRPGVCTALTSRPVLQLGQMVGELPTQPQPTDAADLAMHAWMRTASR